MSYQQQYEQLLNEIEQFKRNNLTKEELQVLYKYLEKQYLPYDDLALTEVVNKIKRIIEA